MSRQLKNRRFLAVVLCICLILANFVLNCEVANAATITDDRNFQYSISDGAVTIDKYLGNEKNVVIPKTIGDYPVKTVGRYAFEGSDIESVTGVSVTKLMGKAFGSCKNLVSVDFPALETVGSMMDNSNGHFYGAFYDCEALEKVVFPSVTLIDIHAFASCTNLKEVNTPNLQKIVWDTFNYYTKYDGYIHNLPSIENIFIPCTLYNRNEADINQGNRFHSSEAIKPIHKLEESSWTTVTDATCTTEGERQGTCTDCNEAVTEKIPATGHTLGDGAVITAATCTTTGTKERICSICKEESTKETEEIPATGHTLGDWAVTKAATCTTTGTKERICSVCQEESTKETEVIPMDSTAHSFTNYVYNNDAKVGVDGTETAVCENGCGEKDTRTKGGTALSSGGSSGGGGGYFPPVETTQKPVISNGDGYTTTLSNDGTSVVIVVKDGYELVDVTLNGISKGKVTEIKNLKTGDKIEVTVSKQTAPVAPSDNERLINGVQNTKVWITKTGSGKGWIKLNYKKSKGFKVDYYEVFRKAGKNSKFGEKAFYKTKKNGLTGWYKNTKSLKKGTRYYYKVRGVRIIDGKEYYTQWSKTYYRIAK